MRRVRRAERSNIRVQRSTGAQQTRKVKDAFAPLVAAVDGGAELAAAGTGLMDDGERVCVVKSEKSVQIEEQ
jgi:hypothetical protein